jgi:hypothetical protein
VRGLGGFAVVKVSTLEGFQQGSMGGFRWGFDEASYEFTLRVTIEAESAAVRREPKTHYGGRRAL